MEYLAGGSLTNIVTKMCMTEGLMAFVARQVICIIIIIIIIIYPYILGWHIHPSLALPYKPTKARYESQVNTSLSAVVL